MLGVHVSKVSKVIDGAKRKTMLDALREDCGSLRLTAAQIYTHGPRNSNPNKMDYEKIKKWAADEKIKLYVHSSYLTVSIWNLNETTKELPKVKKYIKMLNDQLIACKKVGSHGLVIHFPNKTLKDVIDTVSCSVFKLMIERHGVPILFEMKPIKNKGVKKGVNYGYVTPDQLNKFCKKVTLSKKLWGVVIDTAHLWGAGVDTTDKKTQDEWFNEFKFPKMIKLIHLNGSQLKTFGSGRDEHIIVFSDDDDMYSKYKKTPKKSGIFSILQFVMKNNLAVICEINRGLEKDVRMSLNLINSLSKECL